MYRLAVFDVDGTLVSREKRVLLDSTLEALSKLKERGIRIAISSGRPPFAMEKSLLEKIDFDYFVCSNGTYVMDGDRQELYRAEIAKETVEELRKDFTANDDALLFQFEDKSYIYHGFKRISSMIDRCLGRLDLLEDERETQDRHERSLPYEAVSVIAKERLEAYKKKYADFVFVEFMEDHYDFFFKHCNKATGVQALCEKLHIPMEEVICFGDALNDIEMLEQCGCGVAMGDAHEQAKNVADYITSSSEEDGIYRACIHFHLI